MRRICDPDYERRSWSEEHRSRLSAIHRKRWGAPEGYATIRGVHVPFEYRAPLRYWSDYIAHHYGEDVARRYLRTAEADGWIEMPRIRDFYDKRREIARTRDAIREFLWSIRYGNPDHP
jgi:hypothetical protein